MQQLYDQQLTNMKRDYEQKINEIKQIHTNELSHMYKTQKVIKMITFEVFINVYANILAYDIRRYQLHEPIQLTHKLFGSMEISNEELETFDPNKFYKINITYNFNGYIDSYYIRITYYDPKTKKNNQIDFKYHQILNTLPSNFIYKIEKYYGIGIQSDPSFNTTFNIINIENVPLEVALPPPEYTD